MSAKIRKPGTKLHLNNAHVNVTAIQLCLAALESKGFRITRKRREYLIWILSRVLHTTDAGAGIRSDSFPRHELGVSILEFLCEVNLITCIDWYSYLPTNREIKNSKTRRFSPSSGLLLADMQGESYISSCAEFESGKYVTMDSGVGNVEVILNRESGVKVPDQLVETLRTGSGLIFDRDQLPAIIGNLSEEREKVNTLLAIRKAIGRSEGIIRPSFRQARDGRLFAFQPALCNLPKIARTGLSNVDGRQLFDVDYRQQEIRIASALSGKKLPEDDFYASIGRDVGLTRAEVKEIINSILNGQTVHNILNNPRLKYAECAERSENYDRVYGYLNNNGFDEILDTLFKKDKLILHRYGAEIFLNAISEAIERFKLMAGLPLFDGWIFAADSRRAKQVAYIFEQASRRILNTVIPVSCSDLNGCAIY